MIAGELFVNLGLLGADKMTKGLEAANSTLGKLSQSSLEATRNLKDMASKWENQVTSFTGLGASLERFEQATGLSGETLQKFQRGLIGVGVSADETKATMMSMQTLMTDIQRGKAVPESMRLALASVGTNFSELKDVYGLMEKLPTMLRKITPDMARSLMSDLGMGSTMEQGLRRFQGNFKNIRPYMTSSQYKGSEHTENVIQDYKLKIEAKLGTLLSGANVEKGLKQIYEIVLKVIDMVESLGKLAEKVGAMEVIGRIFDGLKMIIDGFSSVTDSIKDKGVIGAATSAIGGLAEAGAGAGEYAKESIGNLLSQGFGGLMTSFNPPTLTPSTAGSTTNNNTNTFQINSTDPKAAAKEVHGILQKQNSKTMLDKKKNQTK